MIQYLDKIKSIFPIVTLILVAVLAAGYFYYSGKVSDLATDLKSSQAYAKTLSDHIETMEQIKQAQDAAIVRLQEQEKKHETEQQRIRNAIKLASPNDDALVAPVLGATLASLREHQSK